ncbi:MAG: hypothetical protein FJ387_11205 [Verrucomicrobia bacterium]|nr:hypothetical protein [Verrucomicrobiota bacterium]
MSLAHRMGEGGRGPGEGTRLVNRRLEDGQWFYTPCLGWKEFAPDSVEPFRAQTRVCRSENHGIPTMLRMVFERMIL